MNHFGRRAGAWLRVKRERHTVRFFLAMIVGVTVLYAGLFYLLMPWLEGRHVSAWASLYWTINRLTTTGESEPPSLAYTAPALQALSILIQVSGLAFFFAAFPLAILPALERRLRGAPDMLYPDMQDHIVICGYSPLVESLIDELALSAHPFRIVDNDVELVRELQRKGIPALFGDPTEEADLALAGVEKAKYIIANREDEEDNAKIVLAASARSEAMIFALIDDIDHAHYFKYAGARKVLSPKRLLGVYLAEKATASWRRELFGANELAADCLVVELPVYPGSPFDGLTLRESRIPERSGGASIVGIWHRGKLELEPGPESRMSAENVLVALGRPDQLLELQELTRTIEVPELPVERHFVIAGFGDVGRAVKEVLDAQGVPNNVIEPREKSGEYVHGDSTDEAVLRQAKIDEASTLIVASHVDRDNIFTTLVARKLNPDLHILARANTADSTDKLYRAGADFVFSLSTIAAQMLANMLVGDTVLTLAEGQKVLTVPIGRLAGKTIGQTRIRGRTGCTVIAVIAPDGSLTTNPKPDYRLTAGDTIVVLGYSAQVADFRRRFGV